MKGARIWEGKEGRNERKEGGKEGRQEGRKEGRKKGRKTGSRGHFGQNLGISRWFGVTSGLLWDHFSYMRLVLGHFNGTRGTLEGLKSEKVIKVFAFN